MIYATENWPVGKVLASLAWAAVLGFCFHTCAAPVGELAVEMRKDCLVGVSKE